MSIKSNLLTELEKNKGELVSGGDLAKALQVSRTSIWKHIQELRKEGYEINGIPNKGYYLSNNTDLISNEGIKTYLKKDYCNIPIYAFKTLKSTNETAKQLALNGAKHGTVVISEEQTGGKGRMGRKFYSPANSGIYMSIILRPNLNCSDSVLITTASSVAVCRAIEKLTKVPVKIKWINDIILKNKKIGGILTEAVTNFENYNIEYVVIGIGINFDTAQNSFPTEIQDIASSLFTKENKSTSRNQLCAEVINEILWIIDNLKDCNFIKEYKERSIILNKNIYFIIKGQATKGKAIDINDDGSLVVRKENNEIVVLNSGEISIRKNLN